MAPRARGWSSPLTGTRRTGLGWHCQDNAQLAARAGAFAHCSPFSSARGPLGGPGRSKAACACPGAPGWAVLVDSQATMMGIADLAGGSMPPAVPAMQGPLPGCAAAAGRPGAARPLALRPRPGESRLPVEHWPTGAPTISGRDQVTVLTQGSTKKLCSFPQVGEWRAMPCTRLSGTETFQQSMYGAPSRSWFAVALGSERATIASSSRLWQTSPSSLAKFRACPNLVPSPSFAGVLAGSRQCSQMARLQRRVLPIQPFVANRTSFRAAVRFHDRLFTLAVGALCLLGGVCDGRYAEYARTLQTPF